MKLLFFLRAIMLIPLAILPASSVGQTYTVEEVLRDNQRVQVINRLSEDHRQLVFVEVRRRLAQTDDPSLARLLCQVEPWSFGDIAVDVMMQRELMANLPTDIEPWSDDFAIRDCASANRAGSYFSIIPSQQKDMRTAFTTGTGARWVQNRAVEALRNIRTVDGPLLQATGRRKVRSFYPLLNVLHAAEIHAARGVFLAETDPEGARDALLRASDVFSEWEAGSPAYYSRARNGFRYRNDIAFYKNFYRAVTGNEAALAALREIVNWPALIKDREVVKMLPPNIASVPEVANGKYIDPIYFGRLLPGAAKTKGDEEFRWWQTSYDTRDVLAKVIECFDMISGLSLAARIAELDACIGIYDTEDWRVELASFRGRESEGQKADTELNRLVDLLYRDPEIAKPISEHEEAFNTFYEGGRWTIRTEAAFSRADILVFDEVLQRVRGLPPHRFFRQRVY